MAKLLRRGALVLGLGAALSAGIEDDAHACGGLFCSAANPVNQAAERIIFAQSTGRVDAVIEIQYQGPSESFAWVLPVPGGEAATVGVSSKQALDALQQQSNPLYQFNTTFENCGDSEDDGLAPVPGAPTSPPVAESPDAVEVIASGTVGPYDYVQLAVDDSLPNPADVAVNWLGENGYDVTNLGTELLGLYLEEGMDLIAFRLTKGNDTGSIRPVTLSYSATNPVIPIRPTAVAANDDMGVMVWVLGETRAIPANYLHLELNEAKINWFNPGPTYNDVIIAAADEAGGHGFVTEQSGPSAQFREQLYPSDRVSAFDYLSTGQFASLQEFFHYAVNFATTFNPTTFENELYDGFMDVMSDPTVVPLREGANAAQFIACVDCYFAVDVAVRNDAYPTTPYDPATDPLLAMNVQAFLDALETSVVQPLLDTQALFDEHPTVTRFYTTLSAEEMTEDPVFDFNPDLPAYDNVHTADRLSRCDGTAQITLPQGMILETDGFTWPVTIDDALPMNLRILQLGTLGMGDVGQDNSAEIAALLEELNLGSLPNPTDPNIDPVTDPTDTDVTSEVTDESSATTSSTPDETDNVPTAPDEGSADAGGPINPPETSAPAADDDDEPLPQDGGNEGVANPVDSSDEGCACRVIAPAESHGAMLWAGLPLALALLRRRRANASSASR